MISASSSSVDQRKSLKRRISTTQANQTRKVNQTTTSHLPYNGVKLYEDIELSVAQFLNLHDLTSLARASKTWATSIGRMRNGSYITLRIWDECQFPTWQPEKYATPEIALARNNIRKHVRKLMFADRSEIHQRSTRRTLRSIADSFPSIDALHLKVFADVQFKTFDESGRRFLFPPSLTQLNIAIQGAYSPYIHKQMRMHQLEDLFEETAANFELPYVHVHERFSTRQWMTHINALPKLKKLKLMVLVHTGLTGLYHHWLNSRKSIRSFGVDVLAPLLNNSAIEEIDIRHEFLRWHDDPTGYSEYDDAHVRLFASMSSLTSLDWHSLNPMRETLFVLPVGTLVHCPLRILGLHNCDITPLVAQALVRQFPLIESFLCGTLYDPSILPQWKHLHSLRFICDRVDLDENGLLFPHDVMDQEQDEFFCDPSIVVSALSQCVELTDLEMCFSARCGTLVHGFKPRDRRVFISRHALTAILMPLTKLTKLSLRHWRLDVDCRLSFIPDSGASSRLEYLNISAIWMFQSDLVASDALKFDAPNLKTLLLYEVYRESVLWKIGDEMVPPVAMLARFPRLEYLTIT